MRNASACYVLITTEWVDHATGTLTPAIYKQYAPGHNVLDDQEETTLPNARHEYSLSTAAGGETHSKMTALLLEAGCRGFPASSSHAQQGTPVTVECLKCALLEP